MYLQHQMIITVLDTRLSGQAPVNDVAAQRNLWLLRKYLAKSCASRT